MHSKLEIQNKNKCQYLKSVKVPNFIIGKIMEQYHPDFRHYDQDLTNKIINEEKKVHSDN